MLILCRISALAISQKQPTTSNNVADDLNIIREKERSMYVFIIRVVMFLFPIFTSFSVCKFVLFRIICDVMKRAVFPLFLEILVIG